MTFLRQGLDPAFAKRKLASMKINLDKNKEMFLC